ACWRDNWNRVVLDGRNPELLLKIGCDGERLTVQQWGNRVFAELALVADAMDNAAGTSDYRDTLSKLQTWIDDPSLTLSAQLLNQIREQQGIGKTGRALAEQHTSALQTQDYLFYQEQEFEQEARESVARQQAIEAADTMSFDVFLDSYFADIR
ncbi:glutamate--cysteine ligase, partial [Vibrio natriegens]